MTVLTKRIPSFLLMVTVLFSFCGDLYAQEIIGPQRLTLEDGTQSRYPLLWAAMENDLNAVNELINSGTNVNAKDRKGITALMVASYQGYTPIAEALIEAGANVDDQTKTKITAAHWAVIKKNLDTIEVLKKNGADLSVEDKHGLKPLHWAAMSNYHSFASDLEQLGAEY